jgi:hypothetical protein
MAVTAVPAVQGTTLVIPFVVKRLGVPVDLTGKALVFVAKTTPLMVKKSDVSNSGFTIVNAAQGTASLELSVSETRNLPAGGTLFTVELWQSGDTVQNLVLEGRLDVRTVANVDQYE